MKVRCSLSSQFWCFKSEDGAAISWALARASLDPQWQGCSCEEAMPSTDRKPELWARARLALSQELEVLTPGSSRDSLISYIRHTSMDERTPLLKYPQAENQFPNTCLLEKQLTQHQHLLSLPENWLLLDSHCPWRSCLHLSGCEWTPWNSDKYALPSPYTLFLLLKLVLTVTHSWMAEAI